MSEDYFRPEIKRTTGLFPENFAVVWDPELEFSFEVGEHLKNYNIIPQEQFYPVDLGDSTSVPVERFQTVRKEVLKKLPPHVQALIFIGQAPTRVGAYQSITHAWAYGVYTRPAQTNGYHAGPSNKYYNSSSRTPFLDHQLLPTMMLTAGDIDSAFRLIDRGIWAEGQGINATAWVMQTSDFNRNIRVRYADNYDFNNLKLRLYQGNTLTQRAAMICFNGLAEVPPPRYEYRPGSWIDTLTSYGGVWGNNWGQTTVWDFIDEGATGSAGAVEEPYALPQKFVNPFVFCNFYDKGDTIIEAAWKSIANPYQMLIAGYPLACPYGR